MCNSIKNKSHNKSNEVMLLGGNGDHLMKFIRVFHKSATCLTEMNEVVEEDG